MPKVSVIVPIYNSEKYLDMMLESVRNQTFRDFEAILVNDGSTDGSQDIIDRYCDEDGRFKCITQENKGVSVARNAGLDVACGDYVVFYDSDDIIPDNSIADLYAAGRREFADLVIGLAEFESIDEVHIPEPHLRLAKQKKIDRYDPDMNRTFAIWNKMYKRQVIEENHIRFLPISHTEDGVFTYQFAQNCGTITGCNSVVYRYVRRIAWESESLTQTMSKKSLEDLLKAFNIIEETVESAYRETVSQLEARGAGANELEELDCRFRIFREDMFVRFTSVNLLGDFYRFIWRLDQETIAVIEERVKQYKERIFPSAWEKKVDGRNGDLALYKKILLSPEELAEEPILSVVVTAGVPKDKVGTLISSLYNQNFPSFEVIVDDSLTGGINDAWVNKINFYELKHNENLSYFKQDALKILKGRYVIFIDNPVLFSRQVIWKMYNAILKRNRGLENHFVSVPLRKVTEQGSVPIEANSTVFINELDKIRLRSIYNQLDYFWCNKMFSVVYLRGKKVLFTGDPVRDIAKLYNNSNYKKLADLSIATELDDKDVLSNVSNPWVKLNYKRKIRQDEKIKEFIASQDVRITTKAQKFKNWRLQRMRFAFRFLTRKIIYPISYNWYKRKPIDEKKVIFIEPRLDKLTNSIMEIYDYFKESGEYTIHEHYLRDRYARYRVQYKRAMAFIKDFATAKYAVVAEANNTLGCLPKRPETIVVNTWHGCGAFKRFGFSTADKIFGGSMKEKLKYPLYNNLDIVTVSSPEAVWAFEEAMGLEGKGVVQPLGVSRTDVFFDDDFVKASVARVHEAIPAAKDKKIIFYAPTFRGRIATAVGPDALDVERMAKELSDEYILVIKHHPLVKRPPLLSPDVKDVFAFDMTRNGSIDDLICASDICISDYSSLVFEYSLFERPMIFFAYDLDDYFDWRGFYYDYEELTPGPIVTGTEEIIHYIKNIDTLFDRQQVRDFRQRFMSRCDGHATERIIEKMKEMGAS